MPPALSPYTRAMVFVSAAYFFMFGSVTAGGTRRVAFKRKHCCQHFPAFLSPVFLSSISTSSTSNIMVLRTLPRRLQQMQQHDAGCRHRAIATASFVSRIEQPRIRHRDGIVHKTRVDVGITSSSSSSSSLSSTHTDDAAQDVSVSPSSLPTSLPSKSTAPSYVVILALGNSSDDLERCQRLAQSLGVSVVVRRQENEQAQEEEEQEEQQQQEGSRKGRRSKRGGAKGESQEFKFTMMFDESGRLALGQPGSGFNPLVVDFSGGKTGHRSKHQQGKEQVVKAAALPKRRTATATAPAPANKSHEESSLSDDGNKDGNDDAEARLPVLWDLTAGLGTDSFLLAQAGWRVEMFERSPVVAALVQDALDRARVGDDETASTAASRMSLTVADSVGALAATAAAENREGESPAQQPDVVYLDPMFPRETKGKKKAKSALAKKGMQMLQALLEEEGAGDEIGRIGLGSESVAREVRRTLTEGGIGRPKGGHLEEERRLFDVAMSLATRKVVVKRPVHGAPIVQHVQPSHALVSKNGRFDVYVVPP